MADLLAACARALGEMDTRDAALYRVLMSPRGVVAMNAALLVIASGEHDRFARFTVRPTPSGWVVAGRSLTREQWSLMIEMGAVRECHSAGFGVFTFANAMLQHYILLRELQTARPGLGGTVQARAGTLHAAPAQLSRAEPRTGRAGAGLAEASLGGASRMEPAVAWPFAGRE